jgi:parvulin-like peptidyl-prolyl isomerase
MQRWLSIVLGVGVLALCVALAFFATPKQKAAAVSPAPSTDDTSTASTTSASVDGGGLDLGAVTLGDPALSNGTGPGYRMLDGTAVPVLSEHAPREVTFGVVLLTYAGAEAAPKNARPKPEALELAKKLAADAKTDFKGAVQRGDNGSSDNLGTMQRGVLEPAPEYVLFSLPVGGVSDVVDTPRGFWIVRRID